LRIKMLLLYVDCGGMGGDSYEGKR
jgi:hypothetical protein